MSGKIPLYRQLNESLFNKIGYEVEPVLFFYTNENECKNFTLLEEGDGISDVYLINDKEGIWDPDIHDLIIKQKFSIAMPKFLFGSTGIVTKKSQLGIAVNWHSRSSGIRGTLPISTIGYEDFGREFELELSFKPRQLKGSVVVETILYLENFNGPVEPGFAAIPGTILGVLDSKKFVIDGEGSEFPILEIEAPSKPLWWVECNWTDPMTDSFNSENVCIFINSKHRYYKELVKKGTAISPLLIEVLASSFQVIISYLVQSPDWTDIQQGQNYEKGSIGEAIHYYLRTFNWDASSPERLAKTIREDLYSRIGV